MTNWQQTARKKYPKLTFYGGDGGLNECWIVLAKCPHSQTNHWRYCLVPDKSSANELMFKWDNAGCGGDCRGELSHALWKLNVN